MPSMVDVQMFHRRPASDWVHRFRLRARCFRQQSVNLSVHGGVAVIVVSTDGCFVPPNKKLGRKIQQQIVSGQIRSITD